jgi:hypothetical protein
LIFYTLKGLSYELEIYEDKIKLIRKNWLSFFSRTPGTQTWQIADLSQFEIAVPKMMMMSGKLQWQTFSGEKGSFRFSTTPAMVKKIETYLQKRVIKNHEAKNEVVHPDFKKTRKSKNFAA